MSFKNHKPKTVTDSSGNEKTNSVGILEREPDWDAIYEPGSIVVSSEEHARLICEADEQGNPRVVFEDEAATWMENRTERENEDDSEESE